MRRSGAELLFIRQDAFGHIFNAVVPDHPIKSEYYKKMALHYQLDPPHYALDETPQEFKQVDSDNLRKVLGYHFKHPRL